MPNNPYFRRQQTTAPQNSNKVARGGRVNQTVSVAVTDLTNPNLGSPAGGPAQVTQTSNAGGNRGGNFQQP